MGLKKTFKENKRVANVNNIKRFGNEHISSKDLKMKIHFMSNFDITLKIHVQQKMNYDRKG